MCLSFLKFLVLNFVYVERELLKSQHVLGLLVKEVVSVQKFLKKVLKGQGSLRNRAVGISGKPG